MMKSLNRLAAIEGNLWVFPGHGGSTTLRDEKKYNPYMR
jgi:glyoxylase-like metal-dependent hydrolase (beta-lactamase superfamily II)